MANLRFRLMLLPISALCGLGQAQAGAGLQQEAENDVSYVSADLSNVAVFTKKEARFGPLIALSGIGWSSTPLKYLTPSFGVECVSTGIPGNTLEFAIKRPIKAGEHYGCLRSKFYVKRCFNDCSAAVVEVATPLGAGRPGTLRSYLYVDDCLGVLGHSQTQDFARGIPLDAVWLRGNVGVLASPNYPACKPY